MATVVSTPPRSRSSSGSSSHSTRRHSPNLSLDLTDLPALSQPSPPSNTLIIINLNDPAIFTTDNLTAIRLALTTDSPLYSFSPLKSFRRIICAFHDIESAISVRQKLDGETVLGHRIRVYFGQETKIIEPEENYLKAPDTGRLFFISPPPSPPHGWESKQEDPPNTQTHADDLAAALQRLNARNDNTYNERAENAEAEEKLREMNRHRSDSRTILYHPAEQGHSSALPAIALEDTTNSPSPISPTFAMDEGEKKPMLHTARPPVELME